MVSLSVYFEGAFWVGVLEIVQGGGLRATRFVLGSEPTDVELYDFLMRYGIALLERAETSPAVPVDAARREARVSPKRAAKLAARAAGQVSRRSTASQEAMRLELESRKQEARADHRERARAREEHRREVLRRKRAERRRGR
ncbi:YjdF family protein [Streptosporangium sandarakinum]|uniref:YjdF family protein n=1 Tax=Streptosporangium sandarakinum TaxID=1260955 RepID=UPI0034486643